MKHKSGSGASKSDSDRSKISDDDETIKPGHGGLVETPNKNDVLSGRGGRINSHSGNVQFRVLVGEMKHTYLAKTTKKLEKVKIADQLVQNIRSMDPPGRFLKEDPSSGLWVEIGDEKARKKAGQAMREKAPDTRREVAEMMHHNSSLADQASLKDNIARDHLPSQVVASNDHIVPSQHHHPGQYLVDNYSASAQYRRPYPNESRINYTGPYQPQPNIKNMQVGGAPGYQDYQMREMLPPHSQNQQTYLHGRQSQQLSSSILSERNSITLQSLMSPASAPRNVSFKSDDGKAIAFDREFNPLSSQSSATAGTSMSSLSFVEDINAKAPVFSQRKHWQEIETTAQCPRQPLSEASPSPAEKPAPSSQLSDLSMQNSYLPTQLMTSGKIPNFDSGGSLNFSGSFNLVRSASFPGMQSSGGLMPMDEPFNVPVESNEFAVESDEFAEESDVLAELAMGSKASPRGSKSNSHSGTSGSGTSGSLFSTSDLSSGFPIGKMDRPSRRRGTSNSSAMSITSLRSSDSSWLNSFKGMQGVSSFDGSDPLQRFNESSRSVLSDISTDILALDLADTPLLRDIDEDAAKANDQL